MDRATTDWEKLFTILISTKELISSIYIYF